VSLIYLSAFNQFHFSGGGAGVAPDPLVLNGGASNGRSSVPIGTGTSRAGILAGSTAVPSPPPGSSNKNGAGSPSTSSTGSENRHPLKKRLLESVAKNSDAINSANSSPTSVTAASSLPNIDMQEAQNSPAKIAKMVGPL
jgi:hypothetical protein